MGTAMVRYEENAVIGTSQQLKAFVLSDAFKDGTKAVTPRHLDPDRLLRMVLAAGSRNPRILQCTMGSILKSSMEASTLGLDCSGLLGQGYMVPYRNGKLSQQSREGDVYEAQFQVGYLGLIELARRSGQVIDVRAVAVYEGDEFDYGEGLKPFITHKPLRGDPRKTPDKKDIIYCYAVADFRDGFQKQLVMTIGQIETYRKRSRAANDGPWVTDYEAMCLKTAVKRLAKWLPLSPELSSALTNEETVELTVDSGAFEAVPVERQVTQNAESVLRGAPEPQPKQTQRKPRSTKAQMQARKDAEEAAKAREANPRSEPPQEPSQAREEAAQPGPSAPFEVDDVVNLVGVVEGKMWVTLNRTGNVQVLDADAFENAKAAKGQGVRVIGKKNPSGAIFAYEIIPLADLDDGAEDDGGEIPFR